MVFVLVLVQNIISTSLKKSSLVLNLLKLWFENTVLHFPCCARPYYTISMTKIFQFMLVIRLLLPNELHEWSNVHQSFRQAFKAQSVYSCNNFLTCNTHLTISIDIELLESNVYIDNPITASCVAEWAWQIFVSMSINNHTLICWNVDITNNSQNKWTQQVKIVVRNGPTFNIIYI